jgi:hypothetical protein
MALLKVINGDLAGSSIPVPNGALKVGRADGNDLCLRDASVSSTHCEIAVDAAGNLLVRDLGSTNGTFIEGQKVQQALVASGQRVRFGNLEMVFDNEVAPTAIVEEPVALHLPPPPNAQAARATLPAPPIPAPLAPGQSTCVNHTGVAAAVRCARCGKNLCLQCTREQNIGMAVVQFCLKCGGQCKNLKELAKESARAASIPKNFPTAIANAFKYPLRGNGLILLVIGTIIYASLDAFLHSQTGFLNFYKLIAKLIGFVVGYGYLFAYMQRIVTSSAIGEDEPPEWPEITDLSSDIYRPFFQLFFTMLVAYFPAGVTLYCFGRPAGDYVNLVGDIYFPMALLAVAMSDSYSGLNPIFVFSSILKIPKHYAIVAALFIGLQWLDTYIKGFVLEIPLFMVPILIYWLIYLFLLMATMRILGLMYLLNRRALGWGL